MLAQRLNDFDWWYDQNNLAELLAERLAKKDEKKLEAKITAERTVRRRNGKRVKKEETIKDDSPEQCGNALLGNGYHSTISIPIDPNMLVKEEPGLQVEDQTENYYTRPEQNLFCEELYHDVDVPEQGRYKRSWPCFQPSFQGQRVSHPQAEYSWISGPSESRLVEDMSYRNHSILESMEGSDTHREQVMISTQERFNDSSDDAEGDDHEDCSPLLARGKTSKLKGIIWPGMRLFDAASPEGVRMRNQRKKFEISGALERSSQQTQPTEVIYYGATWAVKEGRVIDGEVHSPPPEGLPPPAKRPRRRALAEKSANEIIGKVGRRKSSQRRFQKLSDVEIHQMSPTPDPSKKLSFGDDQYDTGTLLDKRGFYGSPLKLEHCHDRYESYDHRLQPTVYPFVSNHGFGRAGSNSGKAYQMGDQELSGFPYYLAPLSSFQNISDLRQPMSSFGNTGSRGISREQILGDLHNKGLPGLNKSTNATRNRQSLPSIDTFDHFYPTSHGERSGYQATHPRTIARNQQLEEQTYRQSPLTKPLCIADPKFNDPKTPIKAKCDPDDRALTRGGIYEDSSGDETIDQGIDSTPVRYLTRSAARRMKGHHS